MQKDNGLSLVWKSDNLNFFYNYNADTQPYMGNCFCIFYLLWL